MKYQYEYLEPGTRQYDEFDLSETNRVKAKYIKSCCNLDNGNPFIEALPLPRVGQEVYRAYDKPLVDYNPEEIKKMSELQKQISVASLRNLRVALPFHAMLEQDFYLMLLQSYRNRKSRYYVNSELNIVKDDKVLESDIVLQGNSAAAANAGCTMLGYSGCGKSSSLEILLSNYPQVIEHHSDDMPRFTQIVYLVVVCPANSNFSALYTSIGAEIDAALGNTKPIYMQMISKCKTLGEKAAKICELISLFGIGCIIFDEIQLIDFNSTKENSFESLLTIVNKTKVALFAIGTEDAYEKMFPNIRTSRRTGTLIQASQYCDSKKFFSNIVAYIMKYQWFDLQVQPSEEVIDALYRVTKGIIDQLIAVYMYMQIDYLRATHKPTIDGKYIVKIAEKHFPGMQKLLDDIDTPGVEARRTDLINQAYRNLDQELRTVQMEQQMNNIAESNTCFDEKIHKIQRTNIIRDLQRTISVTGEVYNLSTIEHAVDSVLNRSQNKLCTEAELAGKAYSLMKRKASDKRSKSNKPKPQDVVPLRSLLEACTTTIETAT